MSIFDNLIRNNDNWARMKLIHSKVTEVGQNDREESTFEDSKISVSSFYAQEGEVPDYNSDVKHKLAGVVNEDLKVFVAPSDIQFNNFKHLGVRDRIQIEGSDDFYEIFSIDTDKFWGHNSTHIFLIPLVF